MKRTFEKGSRSWCIERRGAKIRTSWGKIGGKQQSREHFCYHGFFAEDKECELVREKLKAGYHETTTELVLPPLEPLGQALESALVADPDDLAAHMAYADWLSEQPLPAWQARSEVIRLQLCLQGKQPAAERRKASNRVEKIRKEYERAWMGPELAGLLFEEKVEYHPPSMLPLCDYAWDYRMGWIDSLEIGYLTEQSARLLSQSSALRLLRRLMIRAIDRVGQPLDVLARTTTVGNVRELILENLQETASFPDPTALVKRMPHLEELQIRTDDVDLGNTISLTTLTRLRRLKLYGTWPTPLVEIGRNRALHRLEQLEVRIGGGSKTAETLEDLAVVLRSPYLSSLRELTIVGNTHGDALASELVASGILKRINPLDLRMGTLTNAGARILGSSLDFRYLEQLCLEFNRLTRSGHSAFRGSGVKVLMGDQNSGYYWVRQELYFD